MYLQKLYNKLNNYFAERADLTFLSSDKDLILSNIDYVTQGGEVYVHNVNVIIDRADVFNATNLIYYGKDLKKVNTDVNILILEDTYRERFSLQSTSRALTSTSIDLGMYIFIPVGDTLLTEDKMIIWNICQVYSFIIFSEILKYWNTVFTTTIQSHLFDCNDHGLYIQWTIPDNCEEIDPFKL